MTANAHVLPGGRGAHGDHMGRHDPAADALVQKRARENLDVTVDHVCQ